MQSKKKLQKTKLNKLYKQLEKVSKIIQEEKIEDEFKIEDTLYQFIKANQRLKDAILSRNSFHTAYDSYSKMSMSERQNTPESIRANFIRGLSSLNEITFSSIESEKKIAMYGSIVAFSNALFDNLPNPIDKDSVVDIVKRISN